MGDILLAHQRILWENAPPEEGGIFMIYTCVKGLGGFSLASGNCGEQLRQNGRLEQNGVAADN